ncbi:hypothetical protein AMBR_LLDLPDMO_03256 [Lactiplantibacillus plantarum]|nr:hypothetical protein [Lactiplantibacillus plantarum]SPX68146.1 Uncharacterised protein [Lactiplantibacillus plantarum subsp. plantarum]MCG0615904.1 hypothetical protein [Lactiplantibacillus plantarum]MCG0629944.1 hypothetical protein [Lactiplantibacillus plantarum]MCG0634105.1 hypothetical protein [Lactiplantibacillus plantarum]
MLAFFYLLMPAYFCEYQCVNVSKVGALIRSGYGKCDY